MLGPERGSGRTEPSLRKGVHSLLVGARAYKSRKIPNSYFNKSMTILYISG